VRAALAQADEVLVVDDGSPDATQREAREAGARVIEVSGRSAAHARNVGWAEAKHEIVLFTDSDAQPAPGWADALVAALKDPEVAIVGGPIGSLATTRFGRVYHRMYEGIDARNFHDGSAYLPGMNLGVRKALQGRLRFRDDLPGAQCEDVDFLMRAAAMGLRIRFVPEAVVLHHQPSSWSELVEQERRHGMGRARLVALHDELRRPWHTDAWWKWLALSTVGAPIHVIAGLRRLKRIDLPVLALHVVRMGIGDYGYLEGVRALRREAARRAAAARAP